MVPHLLRWLTSFVWVGLLLQFLSCAGDGGSNSTRFTEGEVPFAEFQTHSCIRKHLDEARELNRERLPLYAERTEGRSVAVSQLLITAESILAVTSRLPDQIATEWQNAGIPLLCLDLVPMSRTPKYGSLDSNPLGRDYESIPVADLQRRMLGALLPGHLDPQAGYEAAVTGIERLASIPSYHCMKRHLLESIARSFAIWPHYRKLSEAKGLPSPDALMVVYLTSQIGLLSFSEWVDQKAAPMQKQGIALVCQDVPEVPYTNVEKEFAEFMLRQSGEH